MNCEEAARLLGVAWVGAGLYPDPASQDSFRRVAEELAKLPEAIDFEPLPEELRCRKESVPNQGAALKRFAKLAFGHNLATIRLHPGFSPEDLAAFLQFVAVDPAALVGVGGLASALRSRDLVGIEVVVQASLVPAGSATGPSGTWDLERLIERFSSGIPIEISTTFVEEFADIVENDSEAVAGYLEAFTRLPEETQEKIIERLLGESGQELQGMFLDQLAGHELARLGSRLGPQAATMLADYVAFSTGTRADEAEAAMLDPEALLTFRSEVADRVASRLQELDLTGYTFHVEIPPRATWVTAAQETLSGLFAVEDRPEKRERAARAWTRLVASAVRRGSFGEAADWFNGGEQLRGVDEDLWAAEREGLADWVTPTLFTAVAAGNQAAENLLSQVAAAAPDRLLHNLELDEAAEKRAELAERVVRWIGDPVPVLRALPGLDKSLPAVLAAMVANGMTVEADPRLIAQLHDPRPDVRTGVLYLCGESLNASDLRPFVTDTDPTTKRLALRLIVQSDSPDAVRVLGEALNDASESDRLLIAAALGRIPDGMAYLRSLGKGWKSWLTPEGRANRKLVEKAFGGGS